MSRKRVSERKIMNLAYSQINDLHPTPEEIQAFAEMKRQRGEDGLVTYSKYDGKGDVFFVKLHDAGKRKKGGRYHIDVGYVDEKLVEKDDPDTVHLFLDKVTAPEFIEFVVKNRAIQKTTAVRRKNMID